MIFRFGPFTLDRDKFELMNDGRVVAVEPQVLSVILHLIENREHVVSRDELVQAVWHGRAISDAAIASRIKSARHVLEDDGSSQHLIKTVHGRGFRFVGDVADGLAGGAPASGRAATEGGADAPRAGVDRRILIAGGALAVAGAGVLAWRRRGDDPVPPQIAALVQQARGSMAQNTREGQFQAIGIFRRAVELAPDYADGWGMLGMAYGVPSHYSERAQALDLRRRGEAAARRALQLDPGNGFGELALGILTPFVGDYFGRREHMNHAVAALPGDDDALTYQAVTLQFDGFPAAAVPVYRRIVRRPMPPALYNNYIRALWSAGQVEEADRALDDARELYPTQHTLWLTHYYIRLFSGRVTAAVAQLTDRGDWPAGVDQNNVSAMIAQARAIEKRDPVEVDAVARRQLADARIGAYEGETAVRLLSALGRIDDAFTVAYAYYFGRGFVIPDFDTAGSAFSPEQRQTRWLFEPVTKPMRADPRFEPLVRELGFDAYWRRIGIQPDYRR